MWWWFLFLIFGGFGGCSGDIVCGLGFGFDLVMF